MEKRKRTTKCARAQELEDLRENLRIVTVNQNKILDILMKHEKRLNTLKKALK